MISYRQADLMEHKNLLDHTPMVVDLYHSMGGMTMMDNVYVKGHLPNPSPMLDEKRIYLRTLIKDIMTEMGVWWNRNEQSSREQGLKNLDIIIDKVAKDSRVESVVCDIKNRVGHNIYTVVMK